MTTWTKQSRQSGRHVSRFGRRQTTSVKREREGIVMVVKTEAEQKETY